MTGNTRHPSHSQPCNKKIVNLYFLIFQYFLITSVLVQGLLWAWSNFNRSLYFSVSSTLHLVWPLQLCNHWDSFKHGPLKKIYLSPTRGWPRLCTISGLVNTWSNVGEFYEFRSNYWNELLMKYLANSCPWNFWKLSVSKKW